MYTSNAILASALKKLAWGHVLITFAINIETIDILPDWIGYLMVVGTLSVIAVERPHTETLRPMGYILAVLSGLTWVCKAMGIELPYLVGLTQQIVMVIFFFSLHSELAELGRTYDWPSVKGLLLVRNIYILTSAGTWLVTWIESETLAFVLIIAGFVDVLFLWMYLFNLSRWFRIHE